MNNKNMNKISSYHQHKKKLRYHSISKVHSSSIDLNDNNSKINNLNSNINIDIIPNTIKNMNNIYGLSLDNVDANIISSPLNNSLEFNINNNTSINNTINNTSTLNKNNTNNNIILKNMNVNYNTHAKKDSVKNFTYNEEDDNVHQDTILTLNERKSLRDSTLKASYIINNTDRKLGSINTNNSNSKTKNNELNKNKNKNKNNYNQSPSGNRENDTKKLFINNIDSLINHLKIDTFFGFDTNSNISNNNNSNHNINSNNNNLDNELDNDSSLDQSQKNSNPSLQTLINDLKKENEDLKNDINIFSIKTNDLASSDIFNYNDKINYKSYLNQKINKITKENIRLKQELMSKMNYKDKIRYLIKNQIKDFENILEEIKITSNNINQNNAIKQNENKIEFEDYWSIPNFNNSQLIDNDEIESNNFKGKFGGGNFKGNGKGGSKSGKNIAIQNDLQQFLKSSRQINQNGNIINNINSHHYYNNSNINNGVHNNLINNNARSKAQISSNDYLNNNKYKQNYLNYKIN